MTGTRREDLLYSVRAGQLVDNTIHIDYNVIGNYAGEKTPIYVGFVTEEVHNY